MRKEEITCDICNTIYHSDIQGILQLTIPPNILNIANYGPPVTYNYNDICGICAEKLAVFIRDNLKIK